MRLRTKLAALAVAGGVALTATAAYAYWTTTGSGGGSATAAGSNGTVHLIASINTSAHAPYPGGSNPVSFKAENSGDTDLYVGTVSLSTAGDDSPAGVVTNPSTCAAGDFSMLPIAQNVRIPAHSVGESAVQLPNGGSLVFANSEVSQDTCKLATITLNVVSD